MICESRLSIVSCLEAAAVDEDASKLIAVSINSALVGVSCSASCDIAFNAKKQSIKYL